MNVDELLGPKETLADKVDQALRAPDVETIELDFDSLTFGEMADMEDAIGETAVALFMQTKAGDDTATKPPLKVLIAAIWIIKRRANPDLTYEDVRAMKISGVDLA